MAKNDLIKRMLDSGMTFTQLSQSKAEALTKELVQQGEMKRKEAAKLVDAIVDRGRETTEKLVGMIQDEVAKQLARFANQIDDIEDRIEDLAERMGIGSKDTPSPVVAPEPVVTAPKSPARKAAARKPAATQVAPAPAKRSAPRSAATPSMKAAPASKKGSTTAPLAPAMKAAPARKSAASGQAVSAKAAPKKAATSRKPAAKKSDPVA